MRKSLTAFITSAMLAITLIPTTISTSHAKGSVTIRLNGEGFRKCKAQGDSGYTAIVRGRSTYRATRNADFGDFNIRSCFQTKRECVRFIGRIPYIVPGVHDIRYTSCKARG